MQQSGTTLAMTAGYKHDAFGNLTDEYGTGAETPFRYNGQYYDEETGLIYLRNRYYDPSIGRFTQEDTYWNVNNMIYGDKKGRIIVKYKEQDSDYYSDDTIDFNNFILCNDVKYVYDEEFDDFINEHYSDEKKLGTIKHLEMGEYECDNVQYDAYHISLFPNYNAIIQSSNVYVYCANNPVNFVDPTGEVAVVDDAIFLLAAATAAAAIYWAEHTKGARNSTWDKHSKKRSGAPSKA